MMRTPCGRAAPSGSWASRSRHPRRSGTFLRSFRWGHVRQLDRVSRELLARAWAAGAGPGSRAPDHRPRLDASARRMASRRRVARPSRLHAASVATIRCSRSRPAPARCSWPGCAGDAPTRGRSAGHFLTETIGRVRYAGATGQLTMRADSGFYTHAVVAACSCTRGPLQHQRPPAPGPAQAHRGHPRGGLDAHPLLDRAAAPTWPRPSTRRSPIRRMRSPVRLIVRRVKPTPGSQLALLTLYDYHAFITDRDGETVELEADHRRHAEIENAIRDLKYGVALEPSAVGPVRGQRGLAGGAGDGPRRGPLDRKDRPRCRDRHDQDPATAAVRSPRSADPLGPAAHACTCRQHWPWAERLRLGAGAGSGPSPSRPDRRHGRLEASPRHARHGAEMPIGCSGSVLSGGIMATRYSLPGPSGPVSHLEPVMAQGNEEAGRVYRWIGVEAP